MGSNTSSHADTHYGIYTLLFVVGIFSVIGLVMSTLSYFNSITSNEIYSPSSIHGTGHHKK